MSYLKLLYTLVHGLSQNAFTGSEVCWCCVGQLPHSPVHFSCTESLCALHCGAQVLSSPHPFFQINIEDLEDDLVVNGERSDCTLPDSASSGNKGRAKHGNAENKQAGDATKAGSPEQVQRTSPMVKVAVRRARGRAPGCWPQPLCGTSFLNSSEFKFIHCCLEEPAWMGFL